MKLALRGKGKLGFIDGSCMKAAYKGALEEQWEKCNAIALSWIASTVTSELLPGIIYASNAKIVWADFEERFDRSDLTRIYHLWSEIAALKQAKKPMVTVNEAYAVAAQEESQRTLGVSVRNRDPLTLLAGRNQSNTPRPKKFVPPRTVCDHCGFKGHYKIDCYRLVGYPPGFQSKRKGVESYKTDSRAAEGFKPDFKPNAHLTRNADNFTEKGMHTESHMTPP
ncbi:hypothetical protein KY285_036165 [Solanum tuberosum]|nr:hypothetical protein KY289_036320 [Solanum tuberosum]KAH0639579.1 hypothetical protein KY285_036165 [Solanum tuberosum]